RLRTLTTNIGSHFRVIPTLTVIQHWVFAPYREDLVSSYLLDKIPGARKRPVCPAFDVTVMNRVIVNVMDGGPVMSFAADTTIGATMPESAAWGAFFEIP